MSQTKDFIGFTLDAKVIGNMLYQDPSTRAELIAGFNEAKAGNPVKLTTRLGAANLNGEEGDNADWFGLFISNKKTDDDSVEYWRNKDGQGTRIQFKLRRQKKQQAATQTLDDGVQHGSAGTTASTADIVAQVTAAVVAAMAAKEAAAAGAVQHQTEMGLDDISDVPF